MLLMVLVDSVLRKEGMVIGWCGRRARMIKKKETVCCASIIFYLQWKK